MTTVTVRLTRLQADALVAILGQVLDGPNIDREYPVTAASARIALKNPGSIPALGAGRLGVTAMTNIETTPNMRRPRWSFGVDCGVSSPDAKRENGVYPSALHLSSDQVWDSEVDELIIGPWFHLEALDKGEGLWFLRVGDYEWHVAVEDGKVELLTIDVPDSEKEPLPN